MTCGLTCASSFGNVAALWNKRHILGALVLCDAVVIAVSSRLDVLLLDLRRTEIDDNVNDLRLGRGRALLAEVFVGRGFG